MDKKKLCLYSCMFLLLVFAAAARSAPINQSLSEFTNLTRADNALEVAQEMNVWVGGIFGIFFLIIVFLVAFSITMYFTNHVPRSLAFSTFLLLITSVLFLTMRLVPEDAVYFSVAIFILSAGFAIITK